MDEQRELKEVSEHSPTISRIISQIPECKPPKGYYSAICKHCLHKSHCRTCRDEWITIDWASHVNLTYEPRAEGDMEALNRSDQAAANTVGWWIAATALLVLVIFLL